MDEMKGADQEYNSALTQYNSSANSGGEDIELLAFQTVTGKMWYLQTHSQPPSSVQNHANLQEE